MGIKCPKCQSNNPDTQQYCGECGTQIIPKEEIPATETIVTPKEELTTGSLFAGRYQIIEELGKGGMGRAADTSSVPLMVRNPNESRSCNALAPAIVK